MKTRFSVAAMLLLLTIACGRGEDNQAEAPAGHEEEGDSLSVTLTAEAIAAAGIRVEVVGADTAATAEALTVPGQVELDPRRVAAVSARMPARVETLTVVEGDRVESGDTLAMLYSPAFITAQHDLQQAARRARVLAGTADDAGVRATREAARQRLRRMGLSDRGLVLVEDSGHIMQMFPLAAPFGGTIMEAHVLAGQSVAEGAEIFQLADLSVVDVAAAVPERSLPLVRVGQSARIGLAAYPELEFSGRVERLRGGLDPETRTVAAVIHAANPASRLRPGMFASVHLTIPAAALAATRDTSARLIRIPASAVVSEGEQRFVFVQTGARTFTRRTVDVMSLAPPGSSRPDAANVGITSGLSVGEQLVVSGAFMLKSELAKAALGEHGH